MCGIYSVFQTRPSTFIPDRNKHKLKHRGPDYHQTVNIPHGQLCHSMSFYRLSINGIEEENPSFGMQPFVDNNCFLVCNGEIYNQIGRAHV